MTKPEIMAALDEAGIAYDARARKDALEALLAPLRAEAPPSEDDAPPAEAYAKPAPPEVPAGMVLVRREPVAGTGRDFRLISQAKFDAGGYEHYE